MHFVGAATAPWLAGIGLLISFTATAGTETTIGASLLPAINARTVPALPAGTRLIGDHDHDGLGWARPPGREAEEAPRDTLKASARVFPVVQRAAKGDPDRAPAPSFAQRARDLRETARDRLLSGAGAIVAGLLTPGPATWDPAEHEAEAGFVAVPDLGLGPAADRGAGGDTPEAAPTNDGALAMSDGATPAVPRAVALSSTTPAAADAVPIEVAASSLALPGFTPRRDRDAAPGQGSDRESRPDRQEAAPAPEINEAGTPRYADLIEPEAMDREQRCLAEAVYFEARSEPEAGQAAVAQVVLNRVKSGLYPGNVCGVVYQNRHRYMGCQFSFACEGKALRISDAGSWQSATRIARAVIDGRTYLSEVGNSTHYHADYVRPGWSRRLRKMDVIGRHIFYQLKPGQT